MTSLRVTCCPNSTVSDVEPTAAMVRGVLYELAIDWLHCQNDWLPCWLQQRVVVAPPFTESLPNVFPFGESISVEPTERVSNLPTGIFYIADESVKGPWMAKGEQISTRFAESQQTFEYAYGRESSVPFFPHEVEAIRWIEKSTIERDRWKSRQNFVNVAVVDGPASVSRVMSSDAICIVVAIVHGGSLSFLRNMKCVDVSRPLPAKGRKLVLENLKT